MPKNSRAEKLGNNWPAAVALLGVLPLVAGVLFWKSHRYDPKLFSIEIKEDAPGGSVRATVDPDSAALEKLLPADLSALGWEKAGEVSHYTKENLYEKINGHADSFFAYDFQRLMTAPLKDSGGGDREAEVFVFQMADRKSAFGKYSEERDAEAEVVKVGEEGYRSGAAVFFWKDKYYLQVTAAEEDDETAAACESVARAMADLIPADDFGKPLEASGFFPEEGKIPRRDRYVKKDAFGLDFLTGVFQAEYETEGDELLLFVRETVQEVSASDAFDKLLEFLKENGEILYERGEGGARRIGADLYDTPVLAELKGEWLAGAWGGASADEAGARLDALLRALPSPEPNGGE